MAARARVSTERFSDALARLRAPRCNSASRGLSSMGSGRWGALGFALRAK